MGSSPEQLWRSASAQLRGKRVRERFLKRQAFPCPVAYIIRKRPRQGEAHIRVLKFRHMTAFEVLLGVLQKVRRSQIPIPAMTSDIIMTVNTRSQSHGKASELNRLPLSEKGLRSVRELMHAACHRSSKLRA